MLKKEQKDELIKEGTLRLMTLGEIVLAREIFGSSIVYPRVWIHCDSYLPGGLQKKYVGMSPNGEIYFRKELYKKDFSAPEADIRARHVFIHELAHVWQHQHGIWVRTRGLFSWAANYTYELDKNRNLAAYPLEQQAQIIADYWLLTKYSYAEWNFQRAYQRLVTCRGELKGNDAVESYKKVLAEFLRIR